MAIKWFCIWLLTMVSVSGEEGRMATNDMDVIRERMLAPLMEAPDADRVEEYIAGLQADGHWEDVYYEGKATTSWEPAQHLSRLQVLAQAWFSPESPLYHNEVLGEQISTALDYWLHLDPRRKWWWDAIGAPRMLSYIMLMRDGYLTEFQMYKGCTNLERAILGSTGQNLVWQAEVTARRAVLQRDGGLLRRAFELIASEIKISEDEGIQADFSFHQHKQVIYNHGYGAGFARDNARLAGLVAGTTFEYAPEKIVLLSSYILDGSQWLIHKDMTDFGARGREIARRQRRPARYLAETAKLMLSLATGRDVEFQALIDRVEGRGAPFVGNKHFWRSDMMVHHRGDWYASARMYSTRTFNTDGLSGTDDGLLSHYLAEGAMCLMRHGNEYAQIYPVWDWQHIPGTTVEMEPQKPGEPKRAGETDFVGGVSDGTFGVAAFDLKRDALGARKAWFFMGDMVVCLGAGITCDTEYDVVTTVNQCRLTGDVTLDGKMFAEGDGALDVNWVHHDGMGYVFPKTSRVVLATGTRTGTWKRISAQRSADTVTDSVFMLSIPHGAKPNGGSYAYAVYPDKDVDAIPDLANKIAFEVVKNTPEQQAVWCDVDGVLGLVFYQPGQIQVAGWQVSVDRPCILLLRRAGEAWKLYGSDPTAGSGALNVTVKRDGQAPHTVTLILPDGLMAGASVSETL